MKQCNGLLFGHREDGTKQNKKTKEINVRLKTKLMVENWGKIGAQDLLIDFRSYYFSFIGN